MPIRIIGDTKIDFIGKRRISFVLSSILVAIGIFAMVMLIMGKANLGIQFVGGTLIQGQFEKPVAIGAIRKALSEGGFPQAEIQELKSAAKPNTFLIRIKSRGEGKIQIAQNVLNVIAKNFPDNLFNTGEGGQIKEVGPAVGKTVQSKARWAVFISLLGILAYITIRFDFRFGVAATIATFHDVLTVLGIFYLFNIEITLLVITALLTLAGYSLTDTVVVYDRIRENLKKFHKKADFTPAINRSINEVLSRTILTSLTTMTVVVSIFVAGGPVLRSFSLALILGIIVGTYSSVFVAAPVYVEWEARRPKRFKA